MADEQAKIISTPPEVSFQTENAAPPSPLYIGRDDRLFVRISSLVLGGQTLINYRLMLPGGAVIANTINALDPGAAVGAIQVFDAAEGFLLDLCVTQVGAAGNRGLKFVQVGILRGGTAVGNVAHLLISDYLYDIFPLIWPGGAIRYPRGEEGSFASLAGTTPGAGAEISEVVPSNTVWRLYSVEFQFVTAAAVATRLVRLTIDDGANVYHRTPAVSTQIAALTAQYCASAAGFAGVATSFDIQIPLPGYLILRPGHRVRTITDAIQGADQFSAVRVYAERWLSAL